MEELSFAIYNIHGELTELKKAKFSRNEDIGTILEIIRKNTQYLMDKCKSKKLLGISIAILGWLFEKDGRYTAKTDGFAQLGEVDVKQEMMKMFPKLPVLIDHDANLSALAEWKDYTRECGNRNATMLNIVCGEGFGGGVIINGELFRGAHGIAGEVGHLGINFNSKMPSRSSPVYYGMYEDYASPRALLGNVLDHLMDFSSTVLTEDSTLQDVYAAYENDDELAVWAINHIAHLFAYGLSGLVFVLDPTVIVFGDEIIRSEKFLSVLHRHLQCYLPAMIYQSLDIRVSKFNSDGILLGAGLAMTKFYLSSYRMIDFLRENYIS
jgi:predicted NBD/HSP70 family sugar kinase